MQLFINIRILVAITISLFLVACSSNNNAHSTQNNEDKYMPKLNKNPRYFISIYGHIDPKLNEDIKLIITSDYATTNPKCKDMVDPLARLFMHRQIDKIIIVQPDDHGSYKYTIPLDLYEPDFCGWRADSVSYTLYDNSSHANANIIAIFSRNDNARPPIREKGFENWLCARGLECQLQNRKPIQHTEDIPINKNYKYSINVRNKQNYL